MDVFAVLKEWWGLVVLPLLGVFANLWKRLTRAEAGLEELRRAHDLAIQTLRDQRVEDMARAKESRDRVEQELSQMSAAMRANFDTLLTEIRSLRGGR